MRLFFVLVAFAAGTSEAQRYFEIQFSVNLLESESAVTVKKPGSPVDRQFKHDNKDFTVEWFELGWAADSFGQSFHAWFCFLKR